ncbi:MAG TPA: hypothetical protein H9808_04075 [Candidatus Atopostipes pullistercoris]|uniref:Glutamate--cysteine ligase n=1 Tax=Candidatus Atopostipes pullistercoris TaxID=2838467 RepID=A0A9D2G1W1_9LACT|nr:hypothetical protein [Candidatus Atopostipes pullistercoris]
MNLIKDIKENNLVELFMKGNFGLEKEGLRVKGHANLATSMHPKSLGNREVNPHIKTDYGEAQPEIITPPLAPYSKAYNWLQTLSYVLIANLLDEEYMWPFSVPCNLPEDDSLINISQTSNIELEEYRMYTASKYGKKRQLVNGIHINYSFNPQFLEKLFFIQTQFETIEALRDELYLKLASNFLRYQWLLVYLFGATPVAETPFFTGPFFKDKNIPTEPMRSLRNSNFGFTNHPKVVVRYDSIKNYVTDLQNAVQTGKLKLEREYYGAVRLRGVVKDSASLLEDGIQYLEMRSFDNNPFEVSGLSEEMLQFVHLFFMTMLSLPEKVSALETEKGNNLTKKVASEHPFSKTKMMDEGYWLLGQMQHLITMLELPYDYSELVDQAAEALKKPEKTISGRITTILESGSSLLTMGEELGRHHKKEILSIQSLPGFDHLLLAEQLQIVNMLQLGADVPLEYIEDIHMVD